MCMIKTPESLVDFSSVGNLLKCTIWHASKPVPVSFELLHIIVANETRIKMMT